MKKSESFKAPLNQVQKGSMHARKKGKNAPRATASSNLDIQRNSKA